MANRIENWVIGIDLGAYTTCVEVFRNGRVEIIPDEGQNSFLSCVAFTNHTILAGQAAARQAISNPRNTIFDPAQLLWWSLDRPDLNWRVSNLPFEVVPARNEPLLEVRYRNQDICLKPQEVVALLLAHAKLAEEYLQAKVIAAVVTMSADGPLFQRELLTVAGSIAGLSIRNILSDSSASIVVYGYLRRPVHGPVHHQRETQLVAINVGSRTMDITVATMSDGVIEVRSKVDDPRFGDDYFCSPSCQPHSEYGATVTSIQHC